VQIAETLADISDDARRYSRYDLSVVQRQFRESIEVPSGFHRRVD
jgi:hypothetical protein